LADLITLKDPRSPAAEAYRVLRTSIQFAAIDSPIRTLVVTSPAADEQRSVALANLAVTMAQGGHETILVDADLRRPAQHTIWGLPNAHGLTSMILDEGGTANPPLQMVGIERLSVLTSGPLPPNPADLLGARRMEEAIAALRERADYVLFDAPPVLAVTDTALLATKLDALLLVIRAGVTRRDHAQRAKAVLARAHVRIIGVALTNAPRDASMSTY
jgi:non-specific protein-tyrosine kinase